MDNLQNNSSKKKFSYDLGFWSAITSLIGIPLTIFLAMFSGSKSTTLLICAVTTAIFMLIAIVVYGKLYVKRIKENAVKKAGGNVVENRYQSDFDTLSNHFQLDIVSPRRALMEQRREVLCKRTGADEYYYRHGPAHLVKNFTHNIGSKLSEYINQGRLDIVIRLDKPYMKNEKCVFISTCKFVNMYMTPNEFHTQIKHYGGPEAGSYTVIFPLDKPPKTYSSKIIIRDNHLEPKATNNILMKSTRPDGRVELYLSVDAYELNVGDKISVNWTW